LGWPGRRCVQWAEQAPPTPARKTGGSGQRARRGASEQRQMGCALAARGVCVRVQDGVVAKALRQERRKRKG
jgi:hypothetical protein